MIAFFMCVVLCFSIVGCRSNENQNTVAKEALQRVLDGDESFNYKCLVFDEVREESLKSFRFHTESNALNPFSPKAYAYVDFDADGIEELLILDATLSFFLILRYDNENVNGYILEHIDLQNVKTDGSFLTIRYNSYTAISRVSFEELDCVVTNLAYKNDSTNIYQLNEKSATKDEVEKYFDDWDENTTKISWTTIEYRKTLGF